MKTFCRISTGLCGIAALIFLAAAGYDYLLSVNDVNQILGTSNYLFTAAVFRGGLGIGFLAASFGFGRYLWDHRYETDNEEYDDEE